MADEQLSQEQLLEQQKQNCIFCKIIKGEISSKKVYEDDAFLAVLDINPAAPGHVLLMPKEHIPILAVLSETQMSALFSVASKLAAAVQDAMIAQRVTVMCPSGFAAGQRPPYHLLLHIIPREKGDGLDMLDLEKQDVAQADAVALGATIAEATKQVLLHVGRDDLLKTHHIHKRHPEEPSAAQPQPPSAPVPAAVAISPSAAPQAPVPPSASTSLPASSQESVPGSILSSAAPAQGVLSATDGGAGAQSQSIDGSGPQEFSSAEKALEQVLAMSPELRRFIIMQPELVKDYVAKSPKLSKLFEGVDINALSHMLRAQEEHDALAAHAAAPGRVGAPDGNADGAPVRDAAQPSGELLAARDMREDDLFSFIDGNAALRQWLLEHPKELAENLGKNPRLAAFFAGSDIVAIARRYRDHVLRGGAR